MLAYAPPEAMLHMILSTIGGRRAVGQAAWELGVSVREYRELEAGTRFSELRDVGPDLQALRLAAAGRALLPR